MPIVLDAQELTPPAVLIFNPDAGEKLGVSTNAGGPELAQVALHGAGIPFDAWPTEHQGHATGLARAAVAAGPQHVIAAGGGGTMVNG